MKIWMIYHLLILVTFKENYFTPVGTQIELLNENVILVGVWGDIILAHRV
jgi:hypothetical protein